MGQDSLDERAHHASFGRQVISGVSAARDPAKRQPEGFCTWWCGPQRRNPAASARGGYLLHGAADLLVTLGIFGIPLCETDCAGPARALQNARRVSPVREF